MVGIVGDVHDFGRETEPPPDAYVLQDQAGVGEMSVLVRTKGEPTQVAGAARDQVHQLDNALPITDMSTMDAELDQSSAQRRFYMLLLALFAGLAISLAAVGVYGVMAYSVTRRTQKNRYSTRARREAPASARAGYVPGTSTHRHGLDHWFGRYRGERPNPERLALRNSSKRSLDSHRGDSWLGDGCFSGGYVQRRVLRVDPMVALRDE